MFSVTREEDFKKLFIKYHRILSLFVRNKKLIYRSEMSTEQIFVSYYLTSSRQGNTNAILATYCFTKMNQNYGLFSVKTCFFSKKKMMQEDNAMALFTSINRSEQKQQWSFSCRQYFRVTSNH
jgi:hypothetical protein